MNVLSFLLFVSLFFNHLHSEEDIFDKLLKVAGSNRYLNPDEKDFFSRNPEAMLAIQQGKKFSEGFAAEVCIGNSEDDEADALRHFALACYLAARIGKSKALELLKRHEDNGTISCPDNKGAKCWYKTSQMDIYNNELGIRCGEIVNKAFPDEFLTDRKQAFSLMKKLAKAHFENGDFSILESRQTSQKYSKDCWSSPYYPNKKHERVPARLSEYKPLSLLKSVPVPEVSTRRSLGSLNRLAQPASFHPKVQKTSISNIQ